MSRALIDTTGVPATFAKWRTKAEASRAAREHGHGITALQIYTRFDRVWVVCGVLSTTGPAGDGCVRLAILHGDGGWVADWFDLPPGVQLPTCDLTSVLTGLVGRAVRMLNSDGSWHVVTLVAVEDGYAWYRERGRMRMRHTTQVAAVAPVHVTSTWHRESVDRTWRVKPSGRTLGWRPNSELSGAKCACGWTAYADSRSDARARASAHRSAADLTDAAAGSGVLQCPEEKTK